MSAAEDSDTHPDAPVLEGGVLAALPRARPQRASARRTAARGKTTNARGKTTKSETATTGAAKKTRKAKVAAQPAAKPKPSPSAKPKPGPGEPATRTHATKKPGSGATATQAPATNTKPRRPSRPSAPSEPRAPRQGYEAEEELELGNTVNPPSGAELLESLTDIVSELAGSSLTAGGRLLKEAFSVLRRP